MRPCGSHARKANLPPARLSYLPSSLYFFSVARIVKFATYLATSTFDSIVFSLSADESVWKTIPFCNNTPVISETIFCLISLALAHFSKIVPPFRVHNDKVYIANFPLVYHDNVQALFLGGRYHFSFWRSRITVVYLTHLP